MATGLCRGQPPRAGSKPSLVVIKVKPVALPIRQRQYPVPREALEGIQVHLRHLKGYGIIVLCQGQRLQPVENLHLVNPSTVTLHPTVPSPYMLLRLLPAEDSWFTCLDLKDAFFSIRLASKSQKAFAFSVGKFRNRCNHPVHMDPATPGVQELSHHLWGGTSL
ncbi:Gag-Pol polyprotein [Plecturocebus cupreus]